EVDQVNGRSPDDDEHALGRVERGPAALADTQHRRLAAGRRLPQLDRPRAVSNRGEERAVGRERDAVDAARGAPGVHRHLPALGGACVAYLWAGGSIFEREPPLLAFGILLIVLGAGLAGRSRAAALLVRAGLGAGLVALGWIATSYLRFRGLGATDDLLARVYLLGIVLAVAGVVALFMLVRRVKYNKRAFRRTDLLL